MNNDQINHQLLAQKAKHVQGLRRAVEQAQELHAQRQPAPPAPYNLFTAIVGAAADSAERHDIAAQMIQTYWFNGAEWQGGEHTTMQVWEAALRFTEQALAAGYEWTADGWAKAGKGWSRDKVMAKVGEMVQR